MGLTEELCVDDLRTGKRYVVVIQRVDFRPNRTPIGTGVARFTKKEDAPNKRGNIQLRTPAFYRKLEDGDDLDGAQAADLNHPRYEWSLASPNPPSLIHPRLSREKNSNV